jgi:hypothetical protein
LPALREGTEGGTVMYGQSDAIEMDVEAQYQQLAEAEYARRHPSVRPWKVLVVGLVVIALLGIVLWVSR